jgi:hypothetical protein
LSILAMRSSERLRDVFTFIPPLYYSGRILANVSWSADGSASRHVFNKALIQHIEGSSNARDSH